MRHQQPSPPGNEVVLARRRADDLTELVGDCIDLIEVERWQHAPAIVDAIERRLYALDRLLSNPR